VVSVSVTTDSGSSQTLATSTLNPYCELVAKLEISGWVCHTAYTLPK